jgi:protein ImuB
MSRIVSVWLPHWPILRFLATQARKPSLEPVDPERPFVLSIDASGGPCIAALNAAAEAQGLTKGDRLADARARIDFLQVRSLDPEADHAALGRLALWATRYTPAVSSWREKYGADGFFLDVAGAAHLFGGEEVLLADLSRRLARFGFPARLAIADTAGAAWALSRFGSADAVLPSGQEAEALAPLPIEALRLSRDTRITLRRLGFKRVGALIDKARAPFAARFERELLLHLDQALGSASEPLVYIVPPPVYHSLRYLIEPIVMQEAIVAVAQRLMQDLVHALVRDGVGARVLRLALYRVDGDITLVDVGLSMATQNAAHVARLIDLKLDRIAGTIDPGLGFESIGLSVTTAEPLAPRQIDLVGFDEANQMERCAALVDRLKQRLGPRSVRQLEPVASHLPERAEMACVATGDTSAWPAPEAESLRPLLLLSRPEPADDVMALIPEGPPGRFRWRGAIHTVAKAQGPERISSEWWRDRVQQQARDYYLVEDQNGRRFWLYREGLCGHETARWFVHGQFA